MRGAVAALAAAGALLAPAGASRATTAPAPPVPFTRVARAPGTPAGEALLLRRLARLPLSRETLASYPAAGGPRDLLLLSPRRATSRPLPLVIALHGRGGDPAHACAVFGDLAGYAHVVIACPQGQGRRQQRDSWGAPGQIAALARLPRAVAAALPRLRVDPAGVYAVGASMGGQEALLLACEHPGLLAGVVAVDPVTNLSARYQQLARLPHGVRLQRVMAHEVGGTPAQAPLAYARRSPISYINAIARSRMRVSVWWSSHDWDVRAQDFTQSGAFLRALAEQHPYATVTERYGRWSHSWPYLERPWGLLVELGLLGQRGLPRAPGVERVLSRGA